MARKPMITRTITITQVNVLCLNLTSTEPFNKVVTLPRTYKDNKTLMKKVAELVDNEEEKAVNIVDQKEVETLYGMTEQEFIENAKVLDPETRKEIEEAREAEESTEEAPKQEEVKDAKKPQQKKTK